MLVSGRIDICAWWRQLQVRQTGQVQSIVWRAFMLAWAIWGDFWIQIQVEQGKYTCTLSVYLSFLMDTHKCQSGGFAFSSACKHVGHLE